MMGWLKSIVGRGKRWVCGLSTAIMSVVGLAVMSFAAGESSGGSLDSVAIKSEDLSPLLDGITANIGVILPVGLAIFAVILGITLIPKFIKRFTS